jgi:ATP-binding cassette subfamily G (WHITE) protein 2 (SNQ2)
LVDRKRLSIGLQLVAKPEYLILDEPTSALDSYAAFQIVKLLRQLADEGQAILCTIHQPSTLLFEMFDKVLLIGNGGKPLYFGDIGPQSRTAIAYFQQNGATPCGPDDNPAEYLLDAGNGLRDSDALTDAVSRKASIISLGAGKSHQSLDQVNRDWAQIWRNSPESQLLEQKIAELRMQPSVVQIADIDKSYALSSVQQFPIVFKRFITGYSRNPGYVFGRIAIMLIQGLFSALAFIHVASQPVSFQGAILTMFVLFNMVTFGVAIISFVQPQLIEERAYFLRESEEGFYDWKSFSLSLILAEIPFSILATLVFFCIVYFAVGLRLDMLAPLVVLLTLIIFHLYCATFGQSVAAFAPGLDIAALVASFVATIFPVSSGVPTPYSVMAPVFRYSLYWLSPYQYTIGVLATTQYHQMPIQCVPGEFSVFPPPPGLTCGKYVEPMLNAGAPGYLVDPSSTTLCQYCPISSGDDFIKYQLNLEWSQRWRDFGILCFLLVFNWFMLFVWFWLKSRTKRQKRG